MLADDESPGNLIINHVERIIRNRWRVIKCTTRYGWLTAYCQASKINLNNSESLINFAGKIGKNNCNIVVEQILQLSSDVHPNKIPDIAEALLSEMYTIILFQERLKRGAWIAKNLTSESPSVFTISNSIY